MSSLDGTQIADVHDAAKTHDVRDSVEMALRTLSPRQQRILTMWGDGHTIDEIARELCMSAPRASDEKYKAIRKLQKNLNLA
jgi:RNA polymerase sigma factor (sigma-70 family)